MKTNLINPKNLGLLTMLGAGILASGSANAGQSDRVFSFNGDQSIGNGMLDVVTDLAMPSLRGNPIVFQNGKILLYPNADQVNPAVPLCNLSEAPDSTLGSEAAPKNALYSLLFSDDADGVASIPAGTHNNAYDIKGQAVSFDLAGGAEGKTWQTLKLYCIFPSLKGAITDQMIYRTTGNIFHFKAKAGVNVLNATDAKEMLKKMDVKETVTVNANLCDDNPMFEIEALNNFQTLDSARGETLLYHHGNAISIDEARKQLVNSGDVACGFELLPLPGSAPSSKISTSIHRGEKLISCERQLTTKMNRKTGLFEADITLTSLRTNAKMVCLVGAQVGADGDYKIEFDLRKNLTDAFSPNENGSNIKVDVLRSSEIKMFDQ